jgi:type IV pilus assembly protein PilE
MASRSRLSPRTPRPCGFTLIEVMIAVAVVAILAAVALPSYESQLRRSRRSDAQSFALDLLGRQQQFLLDRRTYATSITAAAADDGLGVAIPASVANFYGVRLVASTVAPPTFTVTLTPTGRQVADACGTLTLDQAGVKTASGSGPCW